MKATSKPVNIKWYTLKACGYALIYTCEFCEDSTKHPCGIFIAKLHTEKAQQSIDQSWHHPEVSAM